MLCYFKDLLTLIRCKGTIFLSYSQDFFIFNVLFIHFLRISIIGLFQQTDD